MFSLQGSIALSLSPPKDQCVICDQYKRENTAASDDISYQEHQERKRLAREEKNKDKQRAKTEASFTSATFDLQAILSIPCGLVSQMFYKRKLSSYNLTFYDQFEGRGYCYLWNETDGGKGSSEVGTGIYLYVYRSSLSLCSLTRVENRTKIEVSVLLSSVVSQSTQI